MLARTLLVGLVILTLGAGHDNNVEWAGVTHSATHDRDPLCPIGGESFTVAFQTYDYDITAARVHVDDGSTTWVTAGYSHDRGPYDIWTAIIPASAADGSLEYYIELTDGSDTDYLGPNGMSSTPPASGWVVDFDTLSHAPLGATLTSDGGAVFKVWAPYPTLAYVRGEFNGWGTGNRMTRLGEYFVAHVSNVDRRDQYKYFFYPNSVWKPDARARALNPGDNYNSRVEDPQHYQWISGDFQVPAFEDMIMYELHVGTFSGRNDPEASGSIPATYADVAAHAEHLAELGINVVSLMPIGEFAWDFSAGYNPVSCWAPEWKYGDPDDLKAMIDALHQHGIAVIQDIIWNHFSATDNYLWDYDGSQIYFDSPAVETPWGSQADFDEPEVRDYFADSARYWLDEFRFDGFRMDATDYMNMYQGSGWGLMQRLNDELDARAVDKICVAEQLPDDPWATRPTSLGGAGFDSQWHDAFNDRLREEILDAGWSQSYVDMWKIRDIINGSGTYLSNANVVNYVELHDEAWPSSGGSRLVKQIDTTYPHDDMWVKGRIKLAYGVVFCAPGIPMILQGSEWLEDTDFGSGDASGADRIDWSKKTTYAPIFQYFKDLIAVRKTNCALRANAGHQVHHLNDTYNLLAFHRWCDSGNDLVIVANFGNVDRTNYRIGFPQGGTWHEILNSQAAVYDGNGSGNGGQIVTDAIPYDGMSYSAAITVPQMGFTVFRYEEAPGMPGDMDCDGDVDFDDIDPFVLALGGQAAYEAAYPDCRWLNADANEDGSVNFDDIDAFVALIGS